MYYNNPHKNNIETLEDVKLTDIKDGEILVYENGVFINKEASFGSSEGVEGPIGPQGPPGEPGKDGEQGPAGEPGQDGAIGPEGPQGEVGPKGETGDTGAVGPKGEDGITQDISHLATKTELESAINNIVIPDVDLTNYYNKEEVNNLIANVEVDVTDPNSHTHNNKSIIDGLGDTNGILSYNGKLVVNDTEYSYRTLPTFKNPNNKGTLEFIKSRGDM